MYGIVEVVVEGLSNIVEVVDGINWFLGVTGGNGGVGGELWGCV